MAVTAWKTPNAAVNINTGEGTRDWGGLEGSTSVAISPSQVQTDGDAKEIYVGVGLKTGEKSRVLRIGNFGFTVADIPAGATIDGIEIEVKRRAGSSGITDYLFQLENDSGNRTSTATADRIGSNSASASLWPVSSTAGTGGTAVYGGATNKLGAALTQALVTAANFGFDLITTNSSGNPAFPYVGFVRMRVYYTEGGTEPPATGRPKVNVAGSWVEKPAKVYIGGAWVEKPAKVYQAGAWVLA